MRIGFLGLQTAFDYYQVGGVESYIRRLTSALIREGCSVDFILTDAAQDHTISINKNCSLRYFSRFNSALNSLKKYDHIVTIYLPFKKRLSYGLFRTMNPKLNFHSIVFTLSKNSHKRVAHLLDLKLSYHSIFAVSPRIFRKTKVWLLNSFLLLPPVSKDYFIPLEEKNKSRTIRVSYAGRIDVGKGIQKTIDLFLRLRSEQCVNLAIYGYYSDIGDHQNKSKHVYKWLRNQKDVMFYEVGQKLHSSIVEENLKNMLRYTDILVLPYTDLGSTIDTPMLLLEGMASNCAILTRPLGDIPIIYGNSDFLIPEEQHNNKEFELIKSMNIEKLMLERHRIHNQISKFPIKEEITASNFLSAISK